ncbi:unnamed protein product [Pylaiella littoralis]
MAVPKSKRSKSKVRTRLSNWKKKAATAAKKALNAAKKIARKKEKESELSIGKDQKNKTEDTPKEIDDKKESEVSIDKDIENNTKSFSEE